MILVLDNYDSFTWNLVHYLREIGAEVRVARNDALSAAEALASGAEAVLISPGPGTPDEAGISPALVAACAAAGARAQRRAGRGGGGGGRRGGGADLARAGNARRGRDLAGAGRRLRRDRGDD